LQHFAALPANEILITDPRSVLIEEPEVDLAHLFGDLVVPRSAARLRQAGK
jgi:hypothetical protein